MNAPSRPDSCLVDQLCELRPLARQRQAQGNASWQVQLVTSEQACQPAITQMGLGIQIHQVGNAYAASLSQASTLVASDLQPGIRDGLQSPHAGHNVMRKMLWAPSFQLSSEISFKQQRLEACLVQPQLMWHEVHECTRTDA